MFFEVMQLLQTLYYKVSSSTFFLYGIEPEVKQRFSNRPQHQVRKSVLHPQITCGQNQTHPSISIKGKLSKLLIFLLSTKPHFHKRKVFFFSFCRQNHIEELWLLISVQTLMSYIRTFHFRHLTNRNSLSKRCMTQMALFQNSAVTSRCE